MVAHEIPGTGLRGLNAGRLGDAPDVGHLRGLDSSLRGAGGVAGGLVEDHVAVDEVGNTAVLIALEVVRRQGAARPGPRRDSLLGAGEDCRRVWSFASFGGGPYARARKGPRYRASSPLTTCSLFR